MIKGENNFPSLDEGRAGMGDNKRNGGKLKLSAVLKIGVCSSGISPRYLPNRR